MTYNITALNNSITTINTLREINNLSNQTLSNGWAIVILILALALTYKVSMDFPRSLITAGAISFFINMILFYLQFVGWYFIVLPIVLIVIGVVLTQPKEIVD